MALGQSMTLQSDSLRPLTMNKVLFLKESTTVDFFYVMVYPTFAYI